MANEATKAVPQVVFTKGEKPRESDLAEARTLDSR